MEFRRFNPPDFATFAEPGYGKLALDFLVLPYGTRRSPLCTEMRTATTDPVSAPNTSTQSTDQGQREPDACGPDADQASCDSVTRAGNGHVDQQPPEPLARRASGALPNPAVLESSGAVPGRAARRACGTYGADPARRTGQQALKPPGLGPAHSIMHSESRPVSSKILPDLAARRAQDYSTIHRQAVGNCSVHVPFWSDAMA